MELQYKLLFHTKNIISHLKFTNLPTFTVPIDFSSLAILLSASVLIGENVVIHGNIGNLPQGDEVFIDILEQLGVKVSIEEEQITVQSPEKLNGGRFDLSNSPDLLPPLAILALKTRTLLKLSM